MTTPAVHSDLQTQLKSRLARKPLLLMAHLVVGYPSLDANWAMVEEMESAGVDLVELQLPFSEPIADGPAFVRANHHAIESGIDWQTYFEFAQRTTGRVSFPTVFMGYYNTIFQMGAQGFCERLEAAGMSGFIVPDLPTEEAAELHAAAHARQLDPVLIMTPTNTQDRLDEIGRAASGFVYCAARKGVTGERTDLSAGVAGFVGRCRAATSLPLGVGFGIRTPDDVRALHGLADIAIIGTAGLDAWTAGGRRGYREFLDRVVAETAAPVE